jgi:hypothetical protein
MAEKPIMTPSDAGRALRAIPSAARDEAQKKNIRLAIAARWRGHIKKNKKTLDKIAHVRYYSSVGQGAGPG